MRLSISYLAIALIITSCKSGVAKIDINDVEKHRAYQDSILNKEKTSIGIIKKSKELISEYRNLYSSEMSNNANYNYYLARLYGRIFYFPYQEGIYDTVNRKYLIDTTDYIKFYDSSFYFADKALSLNQNHIYAMNLFSFGFYTDNYNKDFFKKGSSMFSYNRNSKTYTDRTNYILINADRFIQLDTSSDKSLSRSICEIGLTMIEQYFPNSKHIFRKDKPIDDQTNQLLKRYGDYYNYISQFNDNISVNVRFRKDEIERNYISEYNLLVDEINKQEKIKKDIEAINSISIQHKYACVKEEGMAGLFEIYTDEDYTFAITDMYGNTNSGRGRYSRKDNKLIIISEKGISPKCDGKISISKSGKVLINFGGVQYIEDDDGSYLNSHLNKSIGNELNQLY